MNITIRTPLLLCAFVLFGAPSARAGMIGLYTFDNSANPFEDSSGAGNHITGPVGTAPTWVSAVGYNGSGAHDYSDGGLIAPINVNAGVMPQMTWGAWVRTDTLDPGHYQVLSHENGGWDRTLGLSDRPDSTAGVQYTAFTGAGVYLASGPAVSTTAWSFIATSHNQNTGQITFYADLDASTTDDPLLEFTTAGTFDAGTTTTTIGAFPSGNESWDGAIDQVFIYNEELTPAKVTAIRDRGLPELLGIPDTDPNIIVTPLILFGDLRGLGGAPGPQTQTITISNNGATQTLNISSITFSGADAARYALVAPVPANVAPGGSVNVDVRLTPPPAGGSLVADLNIASNDASDPVISVNVSAIITTDPNIEVSAGNPFGRMTFSAVPAAIQRTVTVQNTGVANALTVNAPTITGTNATNYSILSAPGSIAPGTQADIVVALAPGAEGDFAASLEFTTSDPDAVTFSIPLNASVSVVAPATLVAFYCFNNAADPLRDESGNGWHITDLGGTDPLWGAASGFNTSGAYEFTGDRLIVPVDINPTVLPQMTWGAWVRTNSVAPGQRKVMGHDDNGWDRTIGLDTRSPDGTFRYTTFTGDDPVNASGPVEGTPGPVNTTDWTFIAATYDQTALTTTFYVDLNAATTADPVLRVTEPAGFGTGFPTFAIGGLRPDNGNEAWDGAIDNVFVYSGILTDEQIKTLRDEGKSAIVGPDDFFVTAFNLNPNGTVTLTWNSDPGATYTLHYSFDLTGAISTWPDEADDIASGGATTTYTTGISFSTSPRAFFSVEKN